MPKPLAIDDFELPGDSDIHALLRAFPDIELLRYRDQEFIVHAGVGESEANLDIYLLLNGACLVEQPGATADRKPGSELAVIEARPEAPVFLGEMAYLDTGHRSAAVRSSMNTVALRLKPGHLDAIIDTHPTLTRILCKQFCKRLREANQSLKIYQEGRAMDMAQRFLEPGEVLFEKGDPADNLYQLIDGVLLRETESGEEEILPGMEDAEEGAPRSAFVEPRAFFRGSCYSCTVRAKNKAVVQVIHKDAKRAVLRNAPQLALRLLEEC